MAAVIVLIISATYYLYYNSAFMQQVFANVFYKNAIAENEKVIASSFHVTVSFGSAESLLNRNKHYLRGGCIQKVSYNFVVNGKKYYASKNSYINEFARCNSVFNKAYYFPLNPNWAIVEIDMPDKKYIDNFYSSSLKFLFIFFACILVLYRQKLFLILKKR
ncbi:MAG: hypothetical protein HRT94_03270 [Alphaproteobacteria bacterium]|nr:hypothetical protein [Alphaproteobacteria bacterium]